MDDRQAPEIVPASVAWRDEFTDVAKRLREAFGDKALRIDHIGSTAVPDLGAKDVIDVQVTLASLDDAALVERGGFMLRYEITGDRRPPWVDGPDWHKAYARESSGRRVHIHIRQTGTPNQRYALLFRDYLRASPHAAAAYEEAKRILAGWAPDREAYVEAKDRAIFDLVALGAEQWAAATEWEPGPSDG